MILVDMNLRGLTPFMTPFMAIFVAALQISAPSARSGTLNWIGGHASSDWGAAANWLEGTPFVDGSDVVFGGTYINLLPTTYLGADRRVKSITFNGTASGTDPNFSIRLETLSGTAAANLTFVPGNTGITISSQDSTGHSIGYLLGSILLEDDLTIHNNGAAFRMVRPITGTGFGVTVSGSGNVMFEGQNTYTGPTNVEGGALSVGGGYLSASSEINVAAGASLTTIITNAFSGGATIQGAPWTVAGKISTSKTLTMPASVTLNNGRLEATSSPADFGAYLVDTGNTQVTANGNGGNSISAGSIGIASSRTLTIHTPLASDLVALRSQLGTTSALGGGVVKTGLGELYISAGKSIFTGDFLIQAGTVRTDYSANGNATTLGACDGSRTITINTGGTLVFDQGGILTADFAAAAENLPVLNIAGGTLTNLGYLATDANNALGNITLTNGTLTAAGGSPIGTGANGQGYGSWNLNGTVTSTGQSTISSTASQGTPVTLSASPANNHITSFDVQSGTLAVSAPLGNVTRVTTPTISGLTKTGAGTMVLSGISTYTGPTRVMTGTLLVSGSLGNTTTTVESGATLGGSGTLNGNVIIATGGRHALAVAATPATQVARQIGGVLDLRAVGDILELTAASAPAVGTYTLATAAGGIVGTLSDTVVNLNGITFASVSAVGNSLVLTVLPPSTYGVWANSKGLGATQNHPYMDPEKDGVANLLEFVLNGIPTSSEAGILPTLTSDGTNFVFTFVRTDEAEAGVTLVFQHGSTLDDWTDIPIGPTSSGPVTVSENGSAPDTVTVTLPRGLNTSLYGRLKANQ